MDTKLSQIIGKNKKPFIIAEMSANHNGSLENAKEIISVAKKIGVDAVKIQTYQADSMTLDSNKSDFLIKHGIWKGYKLFDLYNKAQTPPFWQEELFNHARKENILIFSSIFNPSDIDLLMSLNTPIFKIASFELTDIPLIKKVAKTKKPIFLSTGMASEIEIEEALNVINKYSSAEVLLFHCISSYPAKVEEYNLRMIETLEKKFGVLVGLSDHTIGIEASIAAVSLGAVAIEKHFSINHAPDGVDSSFSINPSEMKKLLSKTSAAWKGLGKGNFIRTSEELKNKVFRRSLYFCKNIKKGGIISKENIAIIRPSLGLEPKYFDKVLGMRVKKDVEKGDRVIWDILEETNL